MSMSSKVKRRKKATLAAVFGAICALCGRPVPLAELTLDHIIPLRDGGPNANWNLRLACYRCNHGRHNRI